jgi:predicted Ser/Thr protein kinase
LAEGLCPQCLFDAAIAGQREPERRTSPRHSSFILPTVGELSGRFPQLEIVELLGKGGMGAVYKARQKGLDRLVALKILPGEVAEDSAFAERFVREARVLARLRHPGIVTVHDFGQAGDLYYFLMEYVDGSNLREVIQHRLLRPAEALAIVPQICDALQYAHDAGIVHRDIKPENILLDAHGQVKIADFGLAKLLGHDRPDVSLTGTHQVMGTLRYMAPEQLEGTRSVDHRADIYALGVVIYELLTGEVPAGRFEPPSHKVRIDVRLDEVVFRALAREPERRYQRAGEVKTDVETIASGGTPVQRPRNPGHPSDFERAIAGLLRESQPLAVRAYREATGASPSEARAAVEMIGRLQDVPRAPIDLAARDNVAGYPAPGRPLAPDEERLSMIGRERVARRLRPLAVSLFLLGLATVFVGALLAGVVAHAWAAGFFYYSNEPALVLLLEGIVLGIGSLLMMAAAGMPRLEFRGLTLIAASLAMAPLSPVWIVGFPIGLRALLLMGRADVRRAYAAAARWDLDESDDATLPGLFVAWTGRTTAGVALAVAGFITGMLPWAQYLGRYGGHFGTNYWQGLAVCAVSIAAALWLAATGLMPDWRRSQGRCALIAGVLITSFAVKAMLQIQSPVRPAELHTAFGVQASVGAGIALAIFGIANLRAPRGKPADATGSSLA